jgi:hypothetical protein
MGFSLSRFHIQCPSACSASPERWGLSNAGNPTSRSRFASFVFPARMSPSPGSSRPVVRMPVREASPHSQLFICVREGEGRGKRKRLDCLVFSAPNAWEKEVQRGSRGLLNAIRSRQRRRPGSEMGAESDPRARASESTVSLY